MCMDTATRPGNSRQGTFTACSRTCSIELWGSDKTVVEGEAGCCSARVHAELAVDRGQMGIDGARTKHELFGHLGIREALGHQAQHLDLTGGQPCRVGRLTCGWKDWLWCWFQGIGNCL